MTPPASSADTDELAPIQSSLREIRVAAISDYVCLHLGTTHDDPLDVLSPSLLICDESSQKATKG